ncbi:MAG: hypothetical protein WBD07_12760 [Vicinamibacterales bacterium]
MNDTTADVEARLNALFMQRSGSDRVRMSCEMFALARALMVANITADCPDITAAELRAKVFERTYGEDFEADERTRIAARLRGADR